MTFSFIGGERIQRGRGIGGILKIASKLFSPLMNVTKKALQTRTGKKIVNAVKEQAIDSSINIAQEIASGKNVKESLKDEFQNVKKNAKRKAVEIGSDYLKDAKKKSLLNNKKKKKTNRIKRDKKRDIFS